MNTHEIEPDLVNNSGVGDVKRLIIGHPDDADRRRYRVGGSHSPDPAWRCVEGIGMDDTQERLSGEVDRTATSVGVKISELVRRIGAVEANDQARREAVRAAITKAEQAMEIRVDLTIHPNHHPA